MQIRTLVGQHDTGLFDKADNIRTSKTLGKNVGAAEALQLTQDNKGAEMLIEKQGADGAKTYDVYAIEVEGKEGKSLTSCDMFGPALQAGNVSLEKDLAQKFGGTLAIIAPQNEKSDNPKKDSISYWNVRPDLGQSWKSHVIGYATGTVFMPILSGAIIFSGGKYELGPWLKQVYRNKELESAETKAPDLKAVDKAGKTVRKPEPENSAADVIRAAREAGEAAKLKAELGTLPISE